VRPCYTILSEGQSPAREAQLEQVTYYSGEDHTPLPTNHQHWLVQGVLIGWFLTRSLFNSIREGLALAKYAG
jgi:hypothetical protein